LTLFWSNSCLELDEFQANRWSRKIAGAVANAKNMMSLWVQKPIPGEPGAVKVARPVRRGEWGNTVRLCALLLPYSTAHTGGR
jgi:hypothetical protein